MTTVSSSSSSITSSSLTASASASSLSLSEQVTAVEGNGKPSRLEWVSAYAPAGYLNEIELVRRRIDLMLQQRGEESAEHLAERLAFIDDDCVVRYLIGYRLNENEAAKAILHTVQWRCKFGVPKLRAEDFKDILHHKTVADSHQTETQQSPAHWH